jgi:hypothetical protein
MLNQKPVFFSKNFFLFIVVLLFCGCAAQQKPQGGPRDLTPQNIEGNTRRPNPEF